ncbi:YceI family protein [Rhizobium sp. SG2393]|uniref:YceI family protein n=1 Tax=Rhizobium sp. SG2393 TaxID=3276279 RepID=UPI00366AF7DD
MIATLIRCAAVLAFAVPAVAAAEVQHYRIDPASHIGFHVDQVGGGGITGAIPAVDGSFDIDRQNLAHSRVEIVIRPESVTTGQPRIDTFLRSGAVFDAVDYPEITFRSTRVEQTGPKSATILGVLTARGTTRNATFQATLANEAGSRISFHVTGDIFRVPYGMGVGVPIYSNTVSFDMKLHGLR